jgi:hypothetical protein
VLARRVQGEAYGVIAKALGMERATDANLAFNRALRSRPASEQEPIRTQENDRLNRLAEAVRNNDTLTADEAEKRLRTIEQLRARLMVD